MSDEHLTHLNLGSNIDPGRNLVRALRMLDEAGEIGNVSQAWESRSVGKSGPNYLNACASFKTPQNAVDLKEQIIRPIEAALGRVRGRDKFAARTIDIDIILYDGRLLKHRYWDAAFVVVPLAEIHPGFEHPETREQITSRAARLRQDIWLSPRPEILYEFRASRSGRPGATGGRMKVEAEESRRD